MIMPSHLPTGRNVASFENFTEGGKVAALDKQVRVWGGGREGGRVKKGGREG